GDVTWFSGLRQRNVTRPAALCVMHFFNHQTHHRGQAHAMLTAAGATPDDTDIVAMPRAM
ncbi:MAG: DinB family protein, partial [Pseudomonadota bacterium]